MINTPLQTSQKAYSAWKFVSLDTKIYYVKKIGENLKLHAEKYAYSISEEMYKPIKQSIAEIEKCAWLCEYYAENADRFLATQKLESSFYESYIQYEPLGVILGVMPWNFPFWQVFRFAIPTILAGNTVVVKHASNVPNTAHLIQKIFESVGFPKGCYTNLSIKSNEVAEVIAHPFVKAVSLTGSESAGKSVASEAGKHLKKCVLELGGNNAFIVCEDADIEKTVAVAVNARMQNNGQSCIAAKRFLVQKKIEKKFTIALVEAIRKLSLGDPLDTETQISALAREDLAVELEYQVNKSVALGAKLLLGGKRNKNFYEPTVLNNITSDMPVFFEETFGPVVSISSFETFEEALELSNNSVFGLGVSIFSANVGEVKKWTHLFEEGAVFINEMVKSDPYLPFGGIKYSGYGRELGEFGIKEFVNIKTVVVGR